GPHNWAEDAVGPLTPHYGAESAYRVDGDARPPVAASFHCVGGASVFYGGVSLRFRERDFEPVPEIAGDSGARWPFGYAELAPYYDEVERLLGVAGEAGSDPIEPPRARAFPQRPGELAPVSRRLALAARSLGLRPYRLPLAINYAAAAGRSACVACGTCDGFACAVGAKNDLATVVLGPLLRRGLRLETDTAVTRLVTDGGRVTAVETLHRATGDRRRFSAPHVFLAAGALATPHLLLASGLQRLNPGGDVVGRYLMRHYNEILFGLFPRRPNPEGGFHKQLGIHDYYFGDPAAPGLTARLGPRLGGLQQLTTPPPGLVRAELPRGVGAACARWVGHLTGWLTIAEDQPQWENRVRVDPWRTDRLGLPAAIVTHRHSARDHAAGAALAVRARAILRRAGAWACYRHRVGTFSHGVGTVRLGPDARGSALDAECRFRGLDNLYVVDGSVLPSSAAVNPSLTIAANALRAARRLLARAAEAPEIRRRAAVHG
ncbi:MAG TPA: GMC family oxidoreductase, partial [Gemmatimonadales bacterium]|nr:GMC family oxidoreductase [Gemmatimonadales bacterium]